MELMQSRGLAYQRTIWIDKNKYVPLKENLLQKWNFIKVNNIL